MQQAWDFLEESRDLLALVEPLDNEALTQATDFKGWTVETVIRHLHFWNQMALYALTDTETFNSRLQPVIAVLGRGEPLSVVESEAIPVSGTALVAEWRELFELLAEHYAAADPSRRCAWAGPSMSARSCITARQMETWAHGQEVYDLLGRERVNTDRIRNIVVLGVNTYNWTFQVRNQAPPEPQPWLELLAPSGELWAFGEQQDSNVIRGPAEAFAQVVTQTRNIADTSLEVTGEPARLWMENAQCFAGGVSQPPEPGTRVKHEV